MVDRRRAYSTLQGQRSRRGQARFRLGDPDHGDVAIRPTLYRAWMGSLCIQDAELILQEMLARR